MKKFLLATISMFVLANIGIAQDEVLRLSEPIETGENYEMFGSMVDFDSKQTIALSKLIQSSDKFKGKRVIADGTIKQVCQKKGCFFILADGNNQARITFKDYSFFIPTNSAGRYVKIAGSFNVKELSEREAKHYAKDAGKDPEKINGPQKEYSLVATSVKIVDKKTSN